MEFKVSRWGLQLLTFPVVESRQGAILMAAIHSNVCLELARFLWFPPVILLPPSCLEKSAAAATITCSQSLHPFGFGRGSSSVPVSVPWAP